SAWGCASSRALARRAVPSDEYLDSVGIGRRRNRLRRRVVLFVVAVIAAGVAITAALATRDALRVARDIRAGRAAFHALAQDAFSSGENLDSRTSAVLAQFVRAEREARSSSWIGVWSHVPLLGRPARWLRG